MIISCLIIGANANYGNIAQNIDMHFSDFEKTDTKQLFHIHEHDGEHKDETTEGYSGGEISKGTVLDKDESKHAAFLQQEPEDYIKITLPIEDDDTEDLTLLLYRTQIWADGASVCQHDDSGDACEQPDQGRHYWGIVDSHPDDSLAMCSLQETEYSCLVQLGAEQYVLGNMADTGSEVLYNTKDLNAAPDLNYADQITHPEDWPKIGLSSEEWGDKTNPEDKCVQLYIEVEHDIYQYHNSDEQETREWVEAVLAEVFAVYANDGIRMSVKSMKIWTTPDGYDTNSSMNKLNKFTSDLNGNFDGDIAHLLSYDGGGGIAYVDVLCYPWYGTGYSGLSTTFSKAPTYSWTVSVMAHEIGHQMGSPHTHGCVWGPNGNEAIDCCGADAGYNECSGACNAPSAPVNGGTIMSYCHLTADGINMNHGFGPEPAALMRNRVANASCLTTCEKDTDQGDCKNVCADVDGDGKGNPNDCQETCDGDIAGYVENGDDCDDNNTEKFTGAECRTAEDCGGVLMANCECDPTEAPSTYYEDSDGDSFGNATVTINTCNPPAGYTDQAGDCDDNNSNVFPEATCVDASLCDGHIDSSCACVSVIGSVLKTFYADGDADGYGNPTSTFEGCKAPTAGAYVENSLDCNDNDNTIWIGAPCGDGSAECSAIDSSCTCQVGAGNQTVFADADGDGFGNPAISMDTCGAIPAGYVDNGLDCDDMVLGKAQGSPCSSGTDCITFIDPACYCVITDEDNDGVCDGIDSCPGQDDKIDSNENGRPDCMENCVGESEFDVTFLRTTSATPVAHTFKAFETPVHSVQFTVYNIGRKANSYEEKVSVWYLKNGETILYEDMVFETLKSINEGLSMSERNDWNVIIDDVDITGVHVLLENLVSGSQQICRVNLNDIKFCGGDAISGAFI